MANTKDLINIIANRQGINPNDAKEMIELIFGYLEAKLSKKERIEIRNFGSFTAKAKQNNLNWINKYSLCNQDSYNVINYKMSNNLHLKLNKYFPQDRS